MNALAYLVLMKVKNNILEILRKPAKLIMYLLIIALIAGVFIMSLYTRTSTEVFADLVWLKGILFALIGFFFVTAITKGLKSGDMIYEMSDVNLLFVSPLTPQKILLYGIVRMMTMSFLAGFFILFQSNTLGQFFGLYFDGVLLVLAGFILAVSVMQIVSLIIYSVTNGRPRRKMAVRIIAVIVFTPMIFEAARQFVTSGGDFMVTLEALLRSPITSWTPVVGWTSAGVIAFIEGNIATGALFFGITVLAGAIAIIYIIKSNPDYFEDVLVASETAFEKKRAIAEGQINTEMLRDTKVKVAATGVKGSGASSLFYKHLRESFRANRLGLWGTSSIVYLAGAVVFGVILRMNEPGDGDILVLLQILMWLQVFMIGTGRGLKELYQHYIYMIPESSFSKIIWSNLELMLKVTVEGVFVFGVFGAIVGESPHVVIASIAVYAFFSLLLLGINYLSMRWVGSNMSTGIELFLYFIVVILLMAPGLAAAIAAGVMIEVRGILLGLCILAAWEFLVAIGCFALSKGILHNCDMPVVKQAK